MRSWCILNGPCPSDGRFERVFNVLFEDSRDPSLSRSLSRLNSPSPGSGGPSEYFHPGESILFEPNPDGVPSGHQPLEISTSAVRIHAHLDGPIASHNTLIKRSKAGAELQPPNMYVDLTLQLTTHQV